MKRYFFNDPIAALWMMTRHGFRIPGHHPENLIDYMQGIGVNPECHPLYIHPKSFALLEPRVGDILRLYFYSPEEDDKHGAVMTGFYAGGQEAITWFRDPKDGGIDKEVHKIDDHRWRIIQRAGKPFHWPHCEESEAA